MKPRRRRTGLDLWRVLPLQSAPRKWAVGRPEHLRTRPGTYKISVVATTVLKQHLTGSQTYKSCTKGSGKIKLKGGKKHHHG